MKKERTIKKRKKLHLGKISLHNFPTTLDRKEQKQARGGSMLPGETAVPIVCKI